MKFSDQKSDLFLKKSDIRIPFARQRPSKSFDSCASFMTAIAAANFDWSIEPCDKAPRDLNYERNMEKYGRAMKLTMMAWGSAVAWWLMPRTLDPEVGGSSPTRVKPCCVLEQGTLTPPKYL